MSNNATPKRRYDATRRREQAAQTRVAIVAAAAKVFVERGYAKATIGAIAAAAGVAVETVYRSAAGKAGLLNAAVQAALAGGVERSDVPVERRPGIRALIEEPDPRRKLALYAATQPGVHGRSAPLMAVLAEAAGSDPELIDLLASYDEQRLTGMRRFAAHLAETGALRPGLTVERAADIIWTLQAPDVYTALVAKRGWLPEEYRDWLAETLASALLPPA